MIHEAAAVGFQRESAAYARARPSYHSDVVAAIVAHVGHGRVVDVGAGTGISTAALVASGLDVVAVEPVEAMRTALSLSLSGITVIDGTAESMPVATDSAAAVVVAQAFHWFDHQPALDEIVRVLEPMGMLITLWNVKDESVPWMAAYTAIQDQVQGDTPRYRDMVWRTAIEDDARFELVGEERVPNPQPSTEEHAVARFLSTSFIASLGRDRQQALVDELRLLIAGLGDSFDFPYWTEAQFWQRA